jgi:flagellin-like hook-associated protein FlgL
MSLVINTNNIATQAAKNLSANQTALQKSLARLSSGSKLTQSSDDAGGLAVSTKLMAAINRNVRAQQNVSNTISFLQTQDGALKVASSILDRISELKTMSLDPTKNALDLATYNTEFKQLQQQLKSISKEKFNDIDLFNKFSNLEVKTTEDAQGDVTATRSGLFDKLSQAELTQSSISTNSYASEVSGKTLSSAAGAEVQTTLVFTTPTHGLSATIILSDGAAGSGTVNGSDISAAIKGINDGLEAAGITTIKASESQDGQLVITGSETYQISQTLNDAGGSGFLGIRGLSADEAGATSTFDGVAQTYDYNALADYRVGDVVTGIREDGSQESFLISTAVTGNGRTFDEFAALANTTRLNNNINPNAEVWTSSGSYAAGDVVYDDRNGRYYVSRTGPAVGTATSSKADYLELGNSLPGLSDFAAYDESKQYFADDIVSYDGQLYLATPAATPVTEGEGSPIDNSTDWTRLNISVKGSQSLLDSDNDLADFSVADLRAMIQVAATSRAQNGAEQYRLEKSNEMLATNQANLEAANSKLYDVDVATESTAFARANILVQSSAAMLAQANNAQTVALSLLQ